MSSFLARFVTFYFHVYLTKSFIKNQHVKVLNVISVIFATASKSFHKKF